MNARTDAELVTAVLTGQADAYGVLVRRYQNAYFRFAVRMLGSRDDADDALQSAFVRAYRALDRCRDPERFGAWLYQIVVNECRTLGVRRDRRERKLVRDAEDDFGSVASGLSAGLASEFSDDRSSGAIGLEEVQRAIQQLDDEQREAFLLKHVEALSYEEMATLTGTGVSALKMRVKRACERLRHLLDPVRSHS